MIRTGDSEDGLFSSVAEFGRGWIVREVAAEMEASTGTLALEDLS